MTTHTVTAPTKTEPAIDTTLALRADLLEIINTTMPGQAALPALYALSGVLEMRAARLCGLYTQRMSTMIRMLDVSDEVDAESLNGRPPTIDSYNDAMAALSAAEHRDWAFAAAGSKRQDLVTDINQVLGFKSTVDDRIIALTNRNVENRWLETITRAGAARVVEEWKLNLSWDEYIEGCNGDPQMTREEFSKVKASELGGQKQAWSDFPRQVMQTIQMFEHDTEPVDFTELRPETQFSLLLSFSDEQREAKMRASALKLARSPEDLDTRRRFIKGFVATVRKALKAARFERLRAEDPV